MKLWRITSFQPHGVFWQWHKTKADALKAIPQLMEDAEIGRDSIEVEAVEVPTRKAELVCWLNANAPDHNG